MSSLTLLRNSTKSFSAFGWRRWKNVIFLSFGWIWKRLRELVFGKGIQSYPQGATLEFSAGGEGNVGGTTGCLSLVIWVCVQGNLMSFEKCCSLNRRFKLHLLARWTAYGVWKGQEKCPWDLIVMRVGLCTCFWVHMTRRTSISVRLNWFMAIVLCAIEELQWLGPFCVSYSSSDVV